MKNTEDTKKFLRKKKSPETTNRNDDGLSTGSTLLNLGFSGMATTGYQRGLIYSFVGDSSSGKSVMALSAFAEASIAPQFKDYTLQFADIEGGALMDMEKYFGPKAASKVCSWSVGSLEDFYDHTDVLVKEGRPFVLVLDSMDALWTESQEEHVKQAATARKKGKEVAGTYGTDKAKVNSSRLRVLANGVKDTGSIFIVISQTRQNIGWNSQFNPKTYSGGDAIKFYSRIQLWTSIRENVTAGKYNSHVGIVSQVKITKNHICGWQGKLEIPILRGHGIDDLGACVMFLVDCGHWRPVKETSSEKKPGPKKKTAAKAIVADEFDFEGSPEQLVAKIEEDGLEHDLRMIVTEVWHRIEEESKIVRKPRYV